MGDGIPPALAQDMRTPFLSLALLVGCADASLEPPMPAPEEGAPSVVEHEPQADPKTLFFRPSLAERLPSLTAQEDEGPFDPSEADLVDTPRITFRPTGAGGAVWSSAAGRAALADTMTASADVRPNPIIRAVLPQLHPSKDVCTEPQYMVGEQSIRLPGDKRLKSPARAFATAADAKAYLETVYAALPMFKPFTRANVKLGGGWLYNNGGSHRALDYSRDDVDSGSDPTFVVKSVAPGKVIEVAWAEGGGNRVVVEHTAPNGMKYVTQYLHLRNGKSHDLGLARAIDCEDKEGRCAKYVKFAKNFGDHVSWGTEAHKILVKVGDQVGTHTPLGYAGNTGYGGAGNGLEDDGTPETPRGNVHLHLYTGAQHPTEPGNYVLVDPYGVYDQEDSGCYDLLEDTRFDRLFAPFMPSFHDLPLEVLLTYFGYYAKMGKSPRTLVVYDNDDGTAAAGSFDSSIPGGWRTRINYGGTEFQSWFDTYAGQGLIPRETTVREGSSGLRYTATFRPVRAGEQWEHRGGMTNAAWSQKWQSNVVEAGRGVESYFGYTVDDSPRQAALFSSDTGPFYLYRNRPFAEIQTLINGGFASGYAPVDLNAVDLEGGRRYSAILRQEPGCWAWSAGLSSSAYQTRFANLSSRGYSLVKVQAYGDEDAPDFLGIWRAPSQSPCP
jgi:murein DD-endopeptidase MepM/ murein hydrolase activator NlpD